MVAMTFVESMWFWFAHKVVDSLVGLTVMLIFVGILSFLMWYAKR